MNQACDMSYQVLEDDLDLQLLIQLKLQRDSRLKFAGATTNFDDGIELIRSTKCQILILDHFIEGRIMGLEAAPLIKAVHPEIKIILFTSHDLAVEASREPSIDVYLQKRDMNNLLPTMLRLLKLDYPTK